ncbi:uncharacterized protein LOC121242321 [Juglans microcarpa x Juglans regia]|uniref:uncharacterized protein LOC121242321 n=1 Tax=Juglans microcarpa x Juglans regia TaxID=2249226 RepID=UPI001B7DF539|nr:uncharacterized protein LOC121242321 [Juglans microcarpa x Juglans regia]
MEELILRIGDCGKRLQVRNRMDFGNAQRQLQMGNDRFKLLQDCDPLGRRREEQKDAREEVHKWLERDEVMWRKRAKALWLREGDQNSKFFHTKATHRKKKNSIGKLQNEVVDWKEGEHRDQLIIDYFMNMFTASTQ